MHVFISGVGGVAMGPLARIARDLGYTVSSSDKTETRYTKSVANAGIKVYIGQTAEQINKVHRQQPIDWFVYTSALPEDHPELKFARENGIRLSKRDEFINEVLKRKNLGMLAVAGTHGKTSTAGMLVWACTQLGLPISYSVGTNLGFGPNGKYQQSSRFFVYEADEYDRNFLSFRPRASILTAVDYDHPDTYPTVEEYKQAFKQFATQSQNTITWRSVADYIGVGNDSVFLLDDNDGGTNGFSVIGNHNRRNAALVRKLLSEVINVAGAEDVTRVLNEFPGTERRLEQLSDNIYTDYAHHPVEIQATIAAAREIDPNVTVVYQPHQNIRQCRIADQYKNCFAGAKKVYWLPTYLSRENGSEILSPDELIARVDKVTEFEPANLDGQLKSDIDMARHGGIVVLMSAGDLDQWARDNFTAKQ